MTNQGFRKNSQPGVPGRDHGLQVAGSPFSQAQILQLMKTEFARARRYKFPVSCIVIQADRLTSLTDLYGPELKDVVRRELGRMVREKTRGADHLGLVRDDRYLLVLPHTDGPQALVVAERIKAGFARCQIQCGGQQIPISLSLGVASCQDQETLFFETILGHAEAALERGMAGGGNRVLWFGRDERSETTGTPDEHPAGGRRKDDRRHSDG